VPIVEDVRWSEANHGRWERLTYSEVGQRFPDEAAARFADALHGRPQGGESLAEVAQRVGEGWRALLDQHPGGRMLVVTSATPAQLVLCLACDMSPEQLWRWRIDLGGLTALDVYGGTAIVRMVNEVPRI
jgi:2,3-bisphosphoglycerate-dependent phosphoglycerate mutase/probable phosphoglycerate mutase